MSDEKSVLRAASPSEPRPGGGARATMPGVAARLDAAGAAKPLTEGDRGAGDALPSESVDR
jgi:hypothetical protein